MTIIELLSKKLTRDVGGAEEVLRHLRIHGDHEFTFLRHQSIAFLDLLANPVLERCADHGSYDVHDPLLRCLRQVNLVRQVVCHDWIVVEELPFFFVFEFPDGSPNESKGAPPPEGPQKYAKSPPSEIAFADGGFFFTFFEVFLIFEKASGVNQLPGFLQ